MDIKLNSFRFNIEKQCVYCGKVKPFNVYGRSLASKWFKNPKLGNVEVKGKIYSNSYGVCQECQNSSAQTLYVASPIEEKYPIILKIKKTTGWELKDEYKAFKIR